MICNFQLRVSEVGEKTSVISITCSKKTDTMVKLCEVFESLKLKIITANITAFSGRLLKTVFVEVGKFYPSTKANIHKPNIIKWLYFWSTRNCTPLELIQSVNKSKRLGRSKPFEKKN